MNIKVFSICFDRIDFLPLQAKLFKKFLGETIDFYCVDNSLTYGSEKYFRTTCDSLGIKHVLVPDKYHGDAGLSHQEACNYVVKQYISTSSDICMIIDCDIFPIKPITFDNDFGMAGLEQGYKHIKYFWLGLIIINCNNCKNIGDLDLRGAFIHRENDSVYIPDTRTGFTFDRYPLLIAEHQPCDGGALSYLYIKNNKPITKNLSIDYIRHKNNANKYFPEHLVSKYLDSYNFWVVGDGFIHTGRSSNWDNVPNEEFGNKIELIKEWLYSYL